MSNCRSYLWVMLLLWLAVDARADQPLAATTIVIYNKIAPDSVELAKFYAQQRNIARDHLVGLDCSINEEISREEYDATIAEPLRQAFRERGWWKVHTNAEGKVIVDNSTVQFAAVIKGVPLKIRPVSTPYPGDQVGGGPIADQNAASVDSELSVMALNSRQISGAMPNPYFQSFRGIRDFPNAILLLACRLDAPTSSMVKKMIVDSIATEKNGLLGRAYIDASQDKGPGGVTGDAWLREIAKQLHTAGVPTVMDDSPPVFPAGFPITDCALYYGWYAGEATGPFADINFHFVPGAVAVHIHSYSAATLRDVKANWVAPLLARGAAASLGNVYEPYLQLTAHLDTFNDRLLHGFTLAESAYASVYTLSWMSVVVGDPLYRPYASWLQIETGREFPRAMTDWQMYREFAVKNGSLPANAYRTAARQAAARSRNGAMLEDLGVIEARDGNLVNAASCFQQARATYRNRDDIVRVVIEEADALVRQDKQKRALDLVRTTLKIVSGAPSAPILRQLEQQLAAGPMPKP